MFSYLLTYLLTYYAELAACLRATVRLSVLLFAYLFARGINLLVNPKLVQNNLLCFFRVFIYFSFHTCKLL